MDIFNLFILCIISFFSGSIPFSYIIPRFVKGIDPRTVGSKNVGATNVYRICGLPWAIVASLLDMFKGGIVYFFVIKIFPDFAFAISLVSVLGHCYTPWLGFRGGKGVSTTVGVLIVYNYFIILYLAFVFFPVLILTRYVALSSIISALVAPVILFVLGSGVKNTLFMTAISIFIIYRHSSNIKRLVSGTEKKIY